MEVGEFLATSDYVQERMMNDETEYMHMIQRETISAVLEDVLWREIEDEEDIASLEAWPEGDWPVLLEDEEREVAEANEMGGEVAVEPLEVDSNAKVVDGGFEPLRPKPSLD